MDLGFARPLIFPRRTKLQPDFPSRRTSWS